MDNGGPLGIKKPHESNKALHWTEIPLRSIPASELCRYSPLVHSCSLANESVASIKFCNKKLVRN